MSDTSEVDGELAEEAQAEDGNITLSNFFDDIVMPDPKLRKEKIECF